MIKDLLKRSTYYLSGLTLSKIVSVVAFVLFARALLPAGFGQFVLFTTLIQVITFFFDFGLNQWYQKHAHSSDLSVLIQRLLSARLVTLGLSLSVGGLILTFTHSFNYFVSFILILSLIPEAFLSIVDGYYLEKKNAVKVSMKTTVRMSLLLIGYFAFKDQFSFELICALYLLSSLLTTAWYFPWKLLKHFALSSFSKVWKTLNESRAYAFLIFTSFAYSRGDSLIVGYVLNDVALGLYGSAYRYLESLSLIPTALAQNLFPVSAKEGAVTSKQAKKLTLLMTGIGILISIGVYLNSPLLIVGILGDAYIQAVPLLKIFSLVLILFFVNAPLNTIVLSSSKISKFLPYGVGNTFLNLALNIIFVPIYGVVGAAWVMFTTEITGFCINLYFARKVYSNK